MYSLNSVYIYVYVVLLLCSAFEIVAEVYYIFIHSLVNHLLLSSAVHIFNLTNNTQLEHSSSPTTPKPPLTTATSTATKRRARETESGTEADATTETETAIGTGTLAAAQFVSLIFTVSTELLKSLVHLLPLLVCGVASQLGPSSSWSVQSSIYQSVKSLTAAVTQLRVVSRIAESQSQHQSPSVMDVKNNRSFDFYCEFLINELQGLYDSLPPSRKASAAAGSLSSAAVKQALEREEACGGGASVAPETTRQAAVELQKAVERLEFSLTTASSIWEKFGEACIEDQEVRGSRCTI